MFFCLQILGGGGGGGFTNTLADEVAIGSKFSLVICLQFILSKYIHRLSMARSQKRSLGKQNENFDNWK